MIRAVFDLGVGAIGGSTLGLVLAQLVPSSEQINAASRMPVTIALIAIVALSIGALVACVKWQLQASERAGGRLERNAVALQRIGDAVEKLAEEISRSPCLLQRIHERSNPGLHPDVAKSFEAARRALESQGGA